MNSTAETTESEDWKVTPISLEYKNVYSEMKRNRITNCAFEYTPVYVYTYIKSMFLFYVTEASKFSFGSIERDFLFKKC